MRSLHAGLIAGLVVGALLLAAPVLGKPRPKPSLCPGGRFLVEGPRLVGAAVDAGGDAVVIAEDLVSLDSGCEPVKGKLKATKRATRVKAVWKSCAGQKGRVRLLARLDAATCERLTGKVIAGRRGRRFTAGRPKPVAFTTGDFTPVPLEAPTVGAEGGVIAVTDPAHPLHGLMIEVPPNATPDPVTFEISWAEITGAENLPPGAFVSSKAIRIAASGSERFNAYRMLDRPALITLPYDPPPSGEEWVRFYARIGQGPLESAGFAEQDLVNHRLSFLNRAFGNRSAVPQPDPPVARLPDASWDRFGDWSSAIVFQAVGYLFDASSARSVNTGFRPSANGWRVPNVGSFYKNAHGGACVGMAGSAKHYFWRRHTPRLYDAYLDNWPNWSQAPTPTWLDDAVAFQYFSRAHLGLQTAWSEIIDRQYKPASASGVMRTILGALRITNQPVMLGVDEAWLDALSDFRLTRRAHAVLAYRIDVPKDFQGAVRIFIYDPNEAYSSTNASADFLTITWRPAIGFDPYVGGATRYNYVMMLGFYAAMTTAQLDALKSAADRSFQGDDHFPKVRITSIEGANDRDPATDGTTRVGEHKYVTGDTAVRIRGTISGGWATSFCCAVTKATVLVGKDMYYTSVNNGWLTGDGAFDVTVPVRYGEHELVIIGGTFASPWQPSMDEWSAFWRDVIESTAQPAALEVEFSWAQDKSDVDLYVKEPDGNGKTGDTVYYAHRRGRSETHPYLDVDDTSGLGPEHYIAKKGTKTLYTDASEAEGLYGLYTVKVHYYADHDSDYEREQPIGWTVKWRYMVSCPDPCADPDRDGTWRSGTQSGTLHDANSGNAGRIDRTGPDWSPAITFDYQPEPPPPPPPERANLP